MSLRAKLSVAAVALGIGSLTLPALAQKQVGSLLQSLHSFVANQAPQVSVASTPPPQPWGGPTPGQPLYPQQPPYPPQQQAPGVGGMVGNFLNSGFGQAMTMGAGFGIGDTLINDLFGGFARRRC
jgi:hypothetical protein